MNKFRGKLLDFKKRLSDRHMYSIVITVIGFVAVWGMYQLKTEMEFHQKTENQYNRAFFETVEYVQNVETLMAKSMIANTKEQGIINLSEVWRQANLAQANLGQLPINQLALDNTVKFLTQVSDFSYSLVKQSLDGSKITQKQMDDMKTLYDYSVKMSNNLNQLQAELSQGRIKWGELVKKGTPIFNKTSKNFTTTQFENLEKDFKEFPSLIYDGPFSDGLRNQQPVGLTGDMVNQKQAQNVAVKFIGADKVKEIKPMGTTEGTIKSFNFQVKLNNSEGTDGVVIEITKKGGHPLLYMFNKKIGREAVKIDQAKVAAKKFLESRGFKSMEETYYLKEDGIATINYAYSQNGVTVYPDLIKVKVALDDGEIVGFESKAYLTSHKERKIAAPKVTQEQAKKIINPKLKVFSSGLAIIPTPSRAEKLTYEFKGKVEGRDFIVYVNAVTGREEQILLIVNTPNGILTM
ncbi:MAG: germination protein YpeB [Deltaproteobacteria bacterium]